MTYAETQNTWQQETRAMRAAWKADAIPAMKFGKWEIEKFEIGEGGGQYDLANLMHAIKHGRGTRAGSYTKLSRNGTVVMSDTDAERMDHLEFFNKTHNWCGDNGRVLMAGLGLGCALRSILALDGVTGVDVVEFDEEILANIAPLHDDPRVTYHHGSIFDKKWPRGTGWTICWFDIWDGLSEDNLPEMTRLARSYGNRCIWQGFWGKDAVLRERRRTANAFWRR